MTYPTLRVKYVSYVDLRVEKRLSLTRQLAASHVDSNTVPVYFPTASLGSMAARVVFARGQQAVGSFY